MENKEKLIKDLYKLRDSFNKKAGVNAQVLIAESRYHHAQLIMDQTTTTTRSKKHTLTDKIDGIVCNRLLGPIILFATLLLVYELAIVQGYNLTNYWWPVLGWFQDTIESLLPAQGFFSDPTLTALTLWVVQGITAVLNYIPIFIILFALVAIMEDSGYMARIAFILDRLFKPFGLHGQSALPLMLGGLYVGGCAIPGIMATRAIKDDKARLATILVVPLMNCLAKIPFYVLLIDIFFIQYAGFMMFMISTITIFMALIVSKILSLTVLKNYETAPFIMEMPPYHLPSLTNVFRRVVERTWMFLKKVLTIIIFVMIGLYFLLNFPGLAKNETEAYSMQAQEIADELIVALGVNNPYASTLNTPEKIAAFFDFDDELSSELNGVTDENKIWDINRRYLLKDPEFFKIASKGSFELHKNWIESLDDFSRDYQQALVAFSTYTASLQEYELIQVYNDFYSQWEDSNPLYFNIVRTGSITITGHTIKDADAATISKHIRQVERDRKALRKEVHDQVLQSSFLGTFGKWLEPLTKYTGFNWKINVGLISALAAKENTVATLGSIYQTTDGQGSQALGEKMASQESGLTPLHAAAMIIFMALYPPCLAALLTISAEAGFKWMLFAFAYPTIMGFIFAFILFTGGGLLGLTGLQAMLTMYILLAIVMIVMGFVKPRKEKAV
ncbi:MAG TPA: nucleoside recognition domain-containing protein [Thermotogota bacterium]|nr:nucleoside recognition domain-containing protein [Thermotogota bacterium]HRW35568.1 nucleoside recognition domain-containing protein [Thermotogota bacterium]